MKVEGLTYSKPESAVEKGITPPYRRHAGPVDQEADAVRLDIDRQGNPLRIAARMRRQAVGAGVGNQDLLLSALAKRLEAPSHLRGR